MGDFEYLATDMTLRPPAPADALTRAMNTFSGRLPSEYVDFLRQHNGAEGAVGELVRVEELSLADDEYPELDHLAGLVVFGSNGGLEVFAFDPDGQVLVIPWIGGREDAIPQGSFVDFTRRLIAGELSRKRREPARVANGLAQGGLARMTKVPEFRLIAHPATPAAAAASGFEWADPDVGSRHRIGGVPDNLAEDDYPRCPQCSGTMTFYGQLDSIGDDLVLADAGVVLVFVCFDCFTAAAKIQSG